MRILVLTDTLPFPAKSGRELPMTEIFTWLANRHEVVFAVVSNDQAAFNLRMHAMPSQISRAILLTCGARNLARRVTGEILGTSPAFMRKQLTLPALQVLHELGNFDWVWVSPLTLYGVVEQAQEAGSLTNCRLALGINDTKTTMYADALSEMRQRRIFNAKMITKWLRSFVIRKAERNCLKHADLIHVQTEKEKHNTFKVLGFESDKVLALENGVNGLNTHVYKGHSSNEIAYMTHLNMGRRNESQWFIEKVWPMVALHLPEARLVLIGRPADSGDRIPWLEGAERVEVFGFADDLQGKLSTCRLGVVPTFHSTGLINRLQDMMACGLPAVSTTAAAATVSGLLPDKHCLTADDADTFAHTVIELYRDAESRTRISSNLLSLAKTKRSWQQVADCIESALVDRL